MNATTEITSERVISEIVRAEANLPLAASRLNTTESSLLQVLISDRVALDSLIAQLRQSILIRNYRTLMLVQDDILDSLEKAKLQEKINFYRIISESTSELMGKPNNTLDTLLATIPEEPRRALLTILGRT